MHFRRGLRLFADALIDNPQVFRTNRGSPALQLAARSEPER
jgi:hypothetical protein